MIQDIFPHELNNQYRKQAPQPSDYVFAFCQGKVLLLCDGEKRLIPTCQDMHCDSLIWLFTLDDRNVFLGDGVSPNASLVWEDIRVLRHYKPQELAFAGMTARHLDGFYRCHNYCGGCGSVLSFSETERAMVCPDCGLTMYPQISPAVIVGIVDGDRILLTKYATNHSTYRNYALVAGYTEIGETLEQTVSREVMEEVGLKVKDITYYKNQPWGLSSSLLVGFFAKVDGSSEICRDEDELSVAQWMPREDIEIGDDVISLTREMMQTFKNNEIDWGCK